MSFSEENFGVKIFLSILALGERGSMMGSLGMMGIGLVVGKGERSHRKAYAWAAVRLVACREPDTHGGWFVKIFHRNNEKNIS